MPDTPTTDQGRGRERLTGAQQSARIAILRDAESYGGDCRWSQLHSRGHHFKQVMACVRRGDLSSTLAYEFQVTEAGRQALAALPSGEGA